MSSSKKQKIEPLSAQENGSFTSVVLRAAEFRKQLQEEDSISYIKDYFLNNKDEENVSKYLKAGGSVGELAGTLGKLNLRRRDKTHIIFSAIQMVVVQSISNHRNFSEFEEECKDFLTSYLSELQAVLVSTAMPKTKMVVLKLLASTSLVSGRIAGQILSGLTLGKEEVSSLSAHTDPAAESSLRVSFIHFILSFIVDQSSKVIEKLIAKKVWLPSIFPELKYDSPFIVQLVLSTLEEKVVSNPGISKSSKALVFNAPALFHLSELYSWNPKAWYDNKPQKNYTLTFTESELAEIRGWAHRLLLTICTSPKLGIVFQDATYGTSNAQKNFTLGNFLMKLKEPWEDELKKELALEIVVRCPDVIKPVLASFRPNLKTFSSRWDDIIQFITTVLERTELKLEGLPLEKCLRVVEEVVVPSELLEAIRDGKFLSAPSSHVRHVTISLLCGLLTRYLDIYNQLLFTFSQSDIQSKISTFFINNLPNSMELLQCLTQSYNNKEETLLKEIIQLLILYEKICPTLIDLIRFDDSITKWIEEAMSQELAGCPTPMILSLMRLEIMINPQDPRQEKFLDRLKWTTMVDESEMKERGVEILEEYLERSGLFIGSREELSLWASCLRRYPQPSGGQLIGEALRASLRHASRVYRHLLALHEEAALQQLSPLSLDHFLDVETNEDRAGLGEPFPNTLLQLTPLLPSLLHLLSRGKGGQEQHNFLIAFIIHQFHRQAMIAPFVTLVKSYSCTVTDRVLPYLEGWLHKPVSLDIEPFQTTIYSKALKFILKGKEHSEELIEKEKEEKERELVLETCLFAACELSRLERLSPERLERLSLVMGTWLDTRGTAGLPAKALLSRPLLLEHFRPILAPSSSDLTPLIVLITSSPSLIHSPHSLEQFSHRLAFELKLAKKIVSSLEDDKKVSDLLKIFKLSKTDVKDLVEHVFLMKPKYYQINGKLTPWVTIASHLLNLSTEFRIIVKEKTIRNFLSSFVNLAESSHDLTALSLSLLNYLKTAYTDVHGELLDCFKETLEELCRSRQWFEELCVFLYSTCGGIGLSDVAIGRAVSLLSSHQQLSSSHGQLFLGAAPALFQALVEVPSPPWLSHLVNLHSILPVETCKKVCKRIKKHGKEITTSVEALSCVEMMFLKSDEVYSLYTLLLGWLGDIIKTNDHDHRQSEKICVILNKILNRDIDRNSLESVENSVVLGLLLHGLKLPSSPMIELVKFFLANNIVKLPPGEMFELLTSHSCFLDVLLGSNEAKYSTLKLMLELLNKDSSLINTTHVPILLSSYRATLSKEDQVILKILETYERVGGVNLACWKPYAWGEAATDLYSVRTAAAPVKPNPGLTLDLLNRDLVSATVARFPEHRDLQGMTEVPSDGGVYDPAFYLPLLSQTVTEAGAGAGWRVAGSGALALALAALSSNCSQVRAAAAHVLSRFHSALSKQKDNAIWKHYIEAVRGGIAESYGGEGKTRRVPAIITVFLARASLVMSSPGDPLYKTIHNFLLARPTLRLSRVPAFLEIFHHSLTHQKLHQRWLLEILRDGLRQQSDLQLALDSLTFKFILDFHSSTLATPKVKELIESIVVKCVESVDKKHLLIDSYSILPWAHLAKPCLLRDLPGKVSTPSS